MRSDGFYMQIQVEFAFGWDVLDSLVRLESSPLEFKCIASTLNLLRFGVLFLHLP